MIVFRLFYFAVNSIRFHPTDAIICTGNLQIKITISFKKIQDSPEFSTICTLNGCIKITARNGQNKVKIVFMDNVHDLSNFQSAY